MNIFQIYTNDRQLRFAKVFSGILTMPVVKSFLFTGTTFNFFIGIFKVFFAARETFERWQFI